MRNGISASSFRIHRSAFRIMTDRIPTIEEQDGDGEVRYRMLYESEDKVYIRHIRGIYTRVRKYTGLPLLALFFFIPWFNIDGRQAMHFDLPRASSTFSGPASARRTVSCSPGC